MDRGIRPTTWDGPDRSKWWLFANGVTLNQLDGSLVVPEHMQEVSRDLVAAIDETQQGTFYPQRENDELTRVLKNPEHPGRAVATPPKLIRLKCANHHQNDNQG